MTILDVDVQADATGAAMQAFASVPLSYSVMRAAVVGGVGVMAVVECLILIEQLILYKRRTLAGAAS